MQTDPGEANPSKLRELASRYRDFGRARRQSDHLGGSVA
jgi:hypothetical protein